MVTLGVRVADIHACYALWKSRGAKFFTEPIVKYGEFAATFGIPAAFWNGLSPALGPHREALH
jgi:hypothetical protein